MHGEYLLLYGKRPSHRRDAPQEGNPLYQFSGNGGTFEYVDGNHLRENGGDHRLQWDGDDTFTTTFLWDGVEFSEEWTRTEIPETIDRMLECTGL